MSSSVTRWCTELRGRFEACADPDRASGAAAYMRNQFPFLGIATPARRQIVRSTVSDIGVPTSPLACAEALWRMDEREYQYAACDLLTTKRVLAGLASEDVPRLTALIVTKSWWDTVDVLAPSIVGAILRPTPDLVHAIASEWIDDDNFWLQRSAILLQLKYRAATNEQLLFSCILKRASSTEFFVRKAAGWALRQYAYTAPDHVHAFVESHRSELSALTIREALKHIA